MSDVGPEELAEVIERHQFSFGSEADLQEGIEQVLRGCGVEFRREVRLTRQDRIDFMVGRVGLEVKTGGSISALTRQVHRYAQLDEVDAIVVVAGLERLTDLPGVINGKPVRVVRMIGAAL